MFVLESKQMDLQSAGGGDGGGDGPARSSLCAQLIVLQVGKNTPHWIPFNIISRLELFENSTQLP